MIRDIRIQLLQNNKLQKSFRFPNKLNLMIFSCSKNEFSSRSNQYNPAFGEDQSFYHQLIL